MDIDVISKKYAVTIYKPRTYDEIVKIAQENGIDYNVTQDEENGGKFVKTKKNGFWFDDKGLLVKRRTGETTLNYAYNDDGKIDKVTNLFVYDGIYGDFSVTKEHRYFYEGDRVARAEVIKEDRDDEDAAEYYVAKFKYKEDGSFSYDVYNGRLAYDEAGERVKETSKLLTFVCDANGKIVDAIMPKLDIKIEKTRRS